MTNLLILSTMLVTNVHWEKPVYNDVIYIPANRQLTNIYHVTEVGYIFAQTNTSWAEVTNTKYNPRRFYSFKSYEEFTNYRGDDLFNTKRLWKTNDVATNTITIGYITNKVEL